jgi:hypothetical protein
VPFPPLKAEREGDSVRQAGEGGVAALGFPHLTLTLSAPKGREGKICLSRRALRVVCTYRLGVTEKKK